MKTLETVKDLETTADPNGFVGSFLESDSFLNGIHVEGGVEIEGFKDYLKRTKLIEATEEEKRQIYLDGDSAKQLLLYFDRDHLRLQFDTSKYTREILDKIDAYRNAVQFALDVSNYPKGSIQDNQMAIQEADRKRSIAHNELAEALKNAGIVPSSRLGRMFARLLLIDMRVDTFDGAANEGNVTESFYH